MTAYCSGGPSGPKPSTPEVVAVTAAAVEAAIALAGFPALAEVLGPLAVAAPFQASTFCASDPPADPILTANDLLYALNPLTGSNYINAIARIQQWVQRVLWAQLCECTTIVTPALPALSNPGPVGINPGAPSGVATTPCWNVTQTVQFPAAQSGFTDLAPTYLPYGNLIPFFAPPPTNIPLIPSGVTKLTFTATLSPAFGSGPSAADGVLKIYDVNNTTLQTNVVPNFNTTGQTSSSGTITLPANAYSWSWIFTNGDSIAHSVQMTVTFLCSGQGAVGVETPCCPPDPLLDLKLQQIMGLLTAVYQGLPTAINSYAESTLHSGLTGNGSQPIGAKCVAVKVTITTDIPGAPTSAGDPTFYFNRGYIVPITLEAPIRGSVRLVYNPQLYQLPHLTEAIGYSLPAGETISILELVAGP